MAHILRPRLNYPINIVSDVDCYRHVYLSKEMR